MKNSIFLLAIGVLILLVTACQGPTKPDEKDVTLTGQVLDKVTNNPLEGAVVSVLDVSPEVVQITDSEGKFSLEIKVEKSQDIRVIARKENYYPDTTTVLVVPGRTIPEFTFKLKSTIQLVRLNGQVVNKLTSNPIGSAVVRVLDISPEAVQITDSEGRFNMEVDIENTLDIKVVAFKEGYLPDTTTVLAVPGRIITVPLLRLTPTGQTLTASGEAASIVLVFQSAQNIGVRESGSIETAKLVFEVQDSSGVSVDPAHSVEVKFSIGSAPGGGEFIYPNTARTSNNGQAAVYLWSGTKAGVVQLLAEVTSETKLIRSEPVAIAIHGGLPDSVHFCVIPAKLNFPGYNIFGLTNVMTAFVGDKYANPVRPGTAVYFTTTGGLIEGSSLTNLQGIASVNLISAEPKPEHPTYGKGFATITATTADENQNTIKAETVVLFSAKPVISIDPSSVTIPNGGAQSFTYTVSDQNGNPLSQGTNITVTIDGENVIAKGALNKSLPDTQSRGWTQFAFSVFDTAPDTVVAKPISITVSTTGPNGLAELTITGTGL